MGSESKHRNGDGYGGGEASAATAPQGVPATAKKVVQSVKEIVNCTEQEIYAVLKECDMDPNRAVERLLAQDTFHEVRSKRERRKEMKEAMDSRTRVSNVGLSRGGRTGTGSDRSVIQSGLTHVTYNEQGKAADKVEVGSVGTSVTSSTTHVGGKNTKIDSLSTFNGRQSLGTSDSISVYAQVSSGLQTSLLGVSKGHLSMADIVRMGRTSQSAVSHNHYDASGVSASGISESSLSLDHQNHSEQQVFHDEWPVIEQPITGNSQALNMFASSNANGPSEHPSVHGTAVSLHRNCEVDALCVLWGESQDVAGDNVISGNFESDSNSSKHTIMSSNTGLGSHPNSNSTNTHSSDFHSSYEGHHEDVSLAASDLQRLSIRESTLEVPSTEEKPMVVLPNHLQALAAECSHLSFGTYNGGSNTASAFFASDLSRSGLDEKSNASSILASNHSRSSLEEKLAAVDGSSAQFLDASSAHLGDKQLGFDALRGKARDKNNDFLASPQQELVKYTVPEETLGLEYNTLASISDLSLQKSLWMSPSLPLKQAGLQSGSHSNFPREMHADSNSIPGDVLAFLMSQSQSARYSNVVSSISNPANSMAEVMEPGTFAVRNRSALPQDVTMQSSIHFQQLPDMKGYCSLPQNQSYLATINSQQAFSGNTAYNQSPDMKYNLPRNKNEFLMSRLPAATGRGAFGYGNLGSSDRAGSFLSNQSLGYMVPSSNFDEILPSQYNGGRNLSSIQQQGNFSQWDYGAESRSSFLPERNLYNLMGQPSQASLSPYVSPGYSDLYHSQTRVVDEVQRPGGFQDLSTKQLHEFWQHSH